MEYKDKAIIEQLKSRDGIETKIILKDGTKLIVWNIAWGYDIGEAYAHITTNISPNKNNTSINFFYTYEIDKILIE
jgi:hypothetical protein